MARHYTRGEGHIPPGTIEPKEGQEKLKLVMEKVKKTAEAEQEKASNTLLDRLIAKAGGIEKVKQMLANREAAHQTKENGPSILRDAQREELARGEADAKITQSTRTEYQVDASHPDRILAEITTGQDGATKRVDYTYNGFGNILQKITEEMSGDAKYKTNERYRYDNDGTTVIEEHSTRAVLRSGHEPMGLYKDVLYLADSDERVQDPAALQDLGKQYSFISVKDTNGRVVSEYGRGGYTDKNNAGEYTSNAANTRKQFTHDLKGRVKTEESYDKDKLQLRYSYMYEDRPDGSYTRTRKDITPGKSTPNADSVQQYDSSGRLVAEQNYNGYIISERSYTADGNLARIARRVYHSDKVPMHEKAGWQYTEYSYDKNGREESMTQKARQDR
ncbi:hypothetical protein HY622_00635 [Candidatus Uhrbacteria bacterium]|nr:hypothetical protein [Candidatus Uhrbacteria bacterium]